MLRIILLYLISCGARKTHILQHATVIKDVIRATNLVPFVGTRFS